ncbi:hypothetical protein SAMN05660826_00978 [Caldanaerovirga acetigignens]|uniref:Cof subfamily of IIB subfamily of haloacid dehalogenase superfamily/HAD-superfamily hydrolase, subfamily IIB n=1 Tax=Caldanaerovirga acetigignens TaxID=447595 RepID=A0A1M7IPS2_9FIRM|nr:Cof-type HAD-IIB family hydrolase [Caldanaerovirga acetigignens]SHM42367.1 hypothetical protein SAMN05660826_00978 [Caldanaerovirga acetigignens]
MSSTPYKMIALDVDGTLISSGYTVSSRTRQALRKAIEMGLIVTLATGRFWGSAVRIAKSIPVNAPVVSNDGALIKDVHSGKELFYRPLSLEVAKHVLKGAGRYPSFEVQIFLKERKIFSGTAYWKMQLRRYFRSAKRFSFLGFYNYMKDFVLLPVENAGSLEGALKLLKEAPTKIVISGNPEEIREFSKELTKDLEDGIYITSAIKDSIDILEGSVSKAKGLEVLSGILGIKREEIIAVGDNFNDLEMLRFAGLGVAMGNAPETVKQKADFVTAKNDEDGVAFLVESVLFPDRRTKIYTGATPTG